MKKSRSSLKKDQKTSIAASQKRPYGLQRGAAWLVFLFIFALYGLIISLNIVFPSKYTHEIARESTKYGIDSHTVMAMIWTESKYKTHCESGRGAKGLMQLMPETAEWAAQMLSCEYSAEMLFDAETSIKFGVFYFAYLKNKFKDEKIALMAYNAGEGNVKKWIENGQIDNIPFKETRDYLKRVATAKKIYRFISN